MKKTVDIDATLFKKAKAACGAKTYTETVRLALAALLHQKASENLRAFLGSESDFVDVPRHREKAVH